MQADLATSVSRPRGAAAAPAAVPARPASPAQKPAPEHAPRADETAREVQAALNEAIAELTQKGSELTFQLDHELGRVIVKLVDRNTREVLRQMPTKEALAVARALRDGGSVGALVDADA
jgi:flagellar protein FlaG